MTYKELTQSIKKKQYQPVYFLHGTEPFYIDRLTELIEENVLDEAQRSFNQMVFYGKDTDPKTLIDTASRYPMMAERQVVILKEAQDMKQLAALEPYLKNPVPTTLLLIAHKYKKLDQRTKFAKALKAKSVVFESKKLYDNQVADWITDYARSLKLKMAPAAAELIAEYLGTDLSKISNELDKLRINLEAGSEVTPQTVQDHIGISKDYNVFEFQAALGTKDYEKAFKIVSYFQDNPSAHPMVMVLSSLYRYFTKIWIASQNKNVHQYYARISDPT